MMPWFIRSAVLVLLGVTSACAAEEKADKAAADNITAVHYICERQVEIPVVYVNTAGGSSFAIVQVEGKLVPMTQQASASGARYIALDEQDSYRWYTRGEEASLAFLEADHTAEEREILSACKAIAE